MTEIETRMLESLSRIYPIARRRAKSNAIIAQRDAQLDFQEILKLCVDAIPGDER